MTLTRKTLFIATATLFTALTMNSAFAAAGETALGKCYNHVIGSCNETSKHPGACAEAGMNACDAEFKSKSNSSSAAPAIVRPQGANGVLTGPLQPAVQKIR